MQITEMKIKDYLQSKNVTPEELEKYFEKSKDFEIDGLIKANCYNCNSLFNVERLRVGSWLIGQYCRSCNAINIIYPKLLNEETTRVTVYVEKQQEKN